MTKTSDDTQTIQREVGEYVSIKCGLEGSLTKELGEGVLEAVITTQSIDRQGEIIITEGIDTTSYEKIGNVLYGHDYGGLPIGKPLSLTKMKNKIKVRFQMAIEEYPFARTVYDLVKGGYLNATSIGGIVKQWSSDFQTIEQMDMVEFSIVPVPANAQAIITGRSLEQATGKDIKTIKAEFESMSQSILVDKMKSMPDDEINEAIKALKNLLAVLEENAKAASSAGEPEPAIRHIKKVRLMNSAKAVNQESERVIRILKVKLKD